MAVTLTVVEGPHAGQSFSFDRHDTFLVGRSPEAHFSLPNDGYLSRQHFLVEVNPPLCRLVDLGSHNGTRINGSRVERADLHNDDRIEIGKTVLRVVVPTPNVPPGRPTDSGRFILAPPPPDLAGEELADAARADLEVRWQLGKRVPAEAYLSSWRGLAADPAAAVAVVFAEFNVRQELGERPRPDEFLARFPALAARLRRMLALHAALDGVGASAAPDPTRSPGVDLTGEQLGGYRIRRELGRGGMGVVYLATAPTGSEVALKVVRPAVRPVRGALARFLREVDILRGLRHPRIVTFRESGECAGVVWFAMDYVAGTDLGHELAAGPLEPGRAVGLICQLLEGLAHAHAEGFVHRDVKPANILLGREGGREAAYLTDFGLARSYESSTLSGLSVAGSVAGTAAYMPPEQLLDFRSVKPPADQYGAAATLFHLLAGRPVRDVSGPAGDWYRRLLTEEPASLAALRPDLPSRLSSAIARALARDPKHRFPDAEAFRRSLLPFAGHA